MQLFDAVKEAVPARTAAEFYGIDVKSNGMARCIFHNDRNPSMKLDRRYHCFACQADGDVINLVGGSSVSGTRRRRRKSPLIFVSPMRNGRQRHTIPVEEGRKGGRIRPGSWKGSGITALKRRKSAFISFSQTTISC